MRDLAEEVLRLPAQEIVDFRRVSSEGLVARILGIEDAQRVALQTILRIFRQAGAVILEIFDQRAAPGIAAGCIAQRVEQQRDAIRHAQFLQQLVGHRQQFHVRLRFGRADHFRVDLVELAVTSLLRAFVPEQRAVRRQFQRGVLLPAVREIGAGDPGGEFGPQGKRIPAAILEGIHFLRDNVSRFAERAGKDRRPFEHRHFRAAEAIEFADSFESFDHMREGFGLCAEDILRAPDRLRCFLCHPAGAISANAGNPQPAMPFLQRSIFALADRDRATRWQHHEYRQDSRWRQSARKPQRHHRSADWRRTGEV